MGYRSEVTLTIYENDYKDLIRKAVREKNNDAISLLEYAKVYKKSNIITLHWDWVKWYEGYTDVDFIMNYISSDTIPYNFKRVGEENGDIEELSYYDENYELCDITYVNCCIDLDGAGDIQNEPNYITDIKDEIQELDNPELEPVSEDELLAVIDT